MLKSKMLNIQKNTYAFKLITKKAGSPIWDYLRVRNGYWLFLIGEPTAISSF